MNKMNLFVLVFLVLLPNNEIGVIYVGDENPKRMTKDECISLHKKGSEELSKQFSWVSGGCIPVIGSPV